MTIKKLIQKLERLHMPNAEIVTIFYNKGRDNQLPSVRKAPSTRSTDAMFIIYTKN